VFYLMLFPSTGLKAQVNETTVFQTEIGLRGRWQTGNLNQLGLIPSAQLLVEASKFSISINSSYQYLKVDGFNPVNDFWNFALFKANPKHTLHPILAANIGFARSYKINKSYTIGIGMGYNLRNKSSKDFVEMGVIAGYMDLEYENEKPHKSASFGLLLSTSFPIGENLHISNNLKTYHSSKDHTFWGGSNQIMLHYQLKENLSLNISQDLVFNNQNAGGIEKLNTLMLFGLQYRYTKNLNRSK